MVSCILRYVLMDMRTDVKKLYGDNWSIFGEVYGAVKAAELAKLRFAKCQECDRLTPYRLKSVFENIVQCKRCGTAILVKWREHDDRTIHYRVSGLCCGSLRPVLAGSLGLHLIHLRYHTPNTFENFTEKLKQISICLMIRQYVNLRE